jgi:predicted transport protein
MCPVPNGSKTVDKKERLRTVSNIGIYCSSDGTVDLVIIIHFR